MRIAQCLGIIALFVALWHTGVAQTLDQNTTGTNTTDSNNTIPTVVCISEALVRAEEPEFPWVELQNLVNRTVDISGWFITLGDPFGVRFRIPFGTRIPPNGFYVVSTEQMGFSLNRFGGTLSIVNSTRIPIQTITYPATSIGVSFGRFLTEDNTKEYYVLMSRKTLGAPNAYPVVGPVVISSLRYAINPEADQQYIVLENILNTPVTLYHPRYPLQVWKIIGDTFDMSIPRNLILGPRRKAVMVGGSFRNFVDEVGLSADTSILFFRIQFSPIIPGVLPIPPQQLERSEKLKLYMTDTPLRRSEVAAILLIDQVFYSRSDPWPTSPTPGGFTLVRKNITAFGSDPSNWDITTNILSTLSEPAPDGWVQPEGTVPTLEATLPLPPRVSLKYEMGITALPPRTLRGGPSHEREMIIAQIVPILTGVAITVSLFIIGGSIFSLYYIWSHQVPKDNKAKAEDGD